MFSEPDVDMDSKLATDSVYTALGVCMQEVCPLRYSEPFVLLFLFINYWIILLQI